MTDLSTYVYIKVTEKKEALCLDPGAVDDRPKGLSSRVLCPRTADPYAAGKTTGQWKNQPVRYRANSAWCPSDPRHDCPICRQWALGFGVVPPERPSTLVLHAGRRTLVTDYLTGQSKYYVPRWTTVLMSTYGVPTSGSIVLSLDVLLHILLWWSVRWCSPGPPKKARLRVLWRKASVYEPPC